MDVPILIASIGTGVTSVGVTVQRILIFLDRERDRKFARDVFDRTRCTDGLKGYAELRRAQQAIAPDNNNDGPQSVRGLSIRNGVPVSRAGAGIRRAVRRIIGALRGPA